MKKYIVIVIIVLLLLGYGFTRQKNTGGGVNKIVNNTENKLTSIKDLLGMGKEQKCTWSSDENGIKSSGNMLIKGNKFRQSVTNLAVGESETSMEVVTDGEWTYLWNPKTKEQGMKVKVTDEQKADTQKLANGSLDLGKQFNYNCSPASVSDSEFVPPAEVKFMDLEALQNQFKDLIPSGIDIPKTDGE